MKIQVNLPEVKWTVKDQILVRTIIPWKNILLQVQITILVGDHGHRRYRCVDARRELPTAGYCPGQTPTPAMVTVHDTSLSLIGRDLITFKIDSGTNSLDQCWSGWPRFGG